MAWIEEQIEHVSPLRRHSPDYFEYTVLNYQRMRRLNKTLLLKDEIAAALPVSGSISLWVITEAWCGDSAQSLPVFGSLAEHERVNLNIILRDDNPAIMDLYLTNGSRSIPKVIAVDDTGSSCWYWGPRPHEAQKLFLANKAAGMSREDRERKLHTWYARDKTRSIQNELVDLLSRK